MFGIGMPELVLILAVALIVLGPKRLPEIARSLGRAMGEFKRATNELKSAVNLDEDITDIKHTFNDVKDDVRNMTDVYIDSAPSAEPATDSGSNPDAPVSADDRTADAKPADEDRKND